MARRWGWAALVLVAAAGWADEINGQLLRPDGAPAGGARVVWLERLADTRPATTADEQGRFRLDHAEQDNFVAGTLVAWDEHGLGLRALDYRQLKPPLRIILLPWQRRAGRLLTADGRPVAGARVTVAGLCDPVLPWLNVPWHDGPLAGEAGGCTTDASGAWHLDRWPPRGGWVEVTKPGQQVIGPTQHDGQLSGDLVVRLTTPTALSGRVVDRRGRPLANCRVTIAPEPRLTTAWLDSGTMLVRPDSTTSARHTVLTDAEGRYHTGHLRARSAVVSLADPSGAAVAAESRHVPLSPGKTVGGVDLVGGPGVMVEISATGTDGGPLADVVVQPLGPDSTQPWGEARTDGRGVARLRCLPGAYAIVCRAPGENAWIQNPRTLSGIFAPDQSAARLTVAFDQGRDLRVVAVDDQGRALAGLTGYLQLAQGCRSATTDAAGECRLRHLPAAGSASVTLMQDGQMPLRSATVDLTTHGAEPLRLTAQSKPRSAVSGRVVDADGRPVAGVRLHVATGTRTMTNGSYAATTDERGRYALTVTVDAPQGGRVIVAASAYSGYQSSALPMDAAPELRFPDLVVTARDRRVAGRVLDEQGQPAAGVLVTGREPNNHREPATAWTDDDGRFELSGLASGRLELLAGRGCVSAEGVVADGQTEATLHLLPWQPTAAARRALALRLLEDVWAADMRQPFADRGTVPALLAPIDPARARAMLAALDPAVPADRGLLATALAPAILANPLAMAEALPLADRLDPETRGEVRLRTALALLDANGRRHATELLDSTPVTDQPPVQTRALHALLAARLARPAGLPTLRGLIARERAAKADLGWLTLLAASAGTDPKLMAAIGAQAGGDELARLRTANIIGLSRAGRHADAADAARRWLGQSFDHFGEPYWLPVLAARPGGEALRRALPPMLAADARLLLATQAPADQVEQQVAAALHESTPGWLVALAAEVAPQAAKAWLDARPAAGRGERSQILGQLQGEVLDASLMVRTLTDPGLVRGAVAEPGIGYSLPRSPRTPQPPFAALALADPEQLLRRLEPVGPRYVLTRQASAVAAWLLASPTDRWSPLR